LVKAKSDAGRMEEEKWLTLAIFLMHLQENVNVGCPGRNRADWV
jgi:hypothetical protein